MRWCLLLLSGCFTNAELERALDRDGDGHQPVVAGGPDCNETRADVNPAAEEICGDGIDNDCDGFIDDIGLGERTWYRDLDGDGHGVDDTVTACSEPEGFAPGTGDCDDEDPSINPDAEDLCDGIDQDCDGRVDDDADALVQFRDADGDGFGVDSQTVTGCGLTPGYVLTAGDCDDTVDSVNPAAEDVCDGLDQNCNGEVDEDVIFTVQFQDADGDGDGTPGISVEACQNLVGYVSTAADCDDNDPTRHSNAIDFCDYIDQDCDGEIDDDAEFLLYYPDGDGDGAGADDAGILDACTPPIGFATIAGDCDDEDPTRSPLLVDGCDGIDTDCDGAIDDDALLTLYFPDADDDGIGTTIGAVEACIPPDGFVQLDGDCDDADPGVRPDSIDACDGSDTDCDGAVDEDAHFRLWWNDADGDGVGTGDPVFVCTPPSGAAQVGGDCDDQNSGVRPGLEDVCDGVDQDCDGATDEDVAFVLWWVDQDHDGVGTGEPFFTCNPPLNAAFVDGDCNDHAPGIRPGVAVDGCDDVDQDCDGVVDEDASFLLWFADRDRDGAGDLSEQSATCDGAPAGYVAQPGDCDDSDATVTIPVWYRDDDDDGWGTGDPIVGCHEPSGFTHQLGDCDDMDGMRNPGLVEICNNHRDDDCDSSTTCRRTGTFFPIDADFVISGGSQTLRLVPSIDDNDTWDWMNRENGGTSWFTGGTDPDFANPTAHRTSCYNATSIADIDNDGISDWLCHDANFDFHEIQLISSVDLAGPPVGRLSSAVPFSRAGVLVHDSTITVWVQQEDLILRHDGPFQNALLEHASTVANIGRDSSFSLFLRPDGLPGMVVTNLISPGVELKLYSPLVTDALLQDDPDDFVAFQNSIFGPLQPELVTTVNGVHRGAVAMAYDTHPWLSTTTFVPSLSNSSVFSETPTFRSEPGEFTVAFPMGDFDGDGHIDFVILEPSVLHGIETRLEVLFGDASGTSTSVESYVLLSEHGSSTLNGDLNGDGYSDQLLSNQGQWVGYWGTGQ